MKKCIALYHLRFEDLGSFAEPIAQAGYAIAYRHAGAAPLTRAEWEDADLVVVLGGPIGVGDTRDYPWLAGELDGLRRRLALARPTLGICLGAQLMALGFGGAVTRRRDAQKLPALEIGWSALDLVEDAGALEALRGVPVLHWHGENILLPEGLGALASTPGTPCQAFQVGDYALALQFHAEFAGAALEEWLSGHTVELGLAGIDLQRLREDTARFGDALSAASIGLLRDWLQAAQA